jgi:integrase
MAGSMRQRGENAWELRVHAGPDPATGKPRYVSRTVHGAKRFAQKELARFVSEVAAATVTPGSGTVSALCERWFAHASDRLSPTTAEGYRAVLDRRILPRWGRLQVRQVRADDLDAWYATLLRSGGDEGTPLSPATVTNVHAVFRRALGQGVKWGWLAINPAVNASPPRALRTPITVVPEPEVIVRIIKASAVINEQLPMFLRLAATSGARRGELCGLRWSDVDLTAGELHVVRSVVEVKKVLIVKDTKTHQERDLTLDPTTIARLTAHRAAAQALVDAAGLSGLEDRYLFSHDPAGLVPWRPNYATLAFVRLMKDLGLTGIRLHDLRHFAVTMMLTEGYDLKTAGGRVGHANSSTTGDIYAHRRKLTDQAAANTLGDLLDNAGDKDLVAVDVDHKDIAKVNRRGAQSVLPGGRREAGLTRTAPFTKLIS